MPRQIVPVSDVAAILLTQDEGDLRYLPITYTPPVFDGYTKAQSDARYEPLDTMYTKAESDAKYLTQALGDARYSLLAHNHDAAYSPVGHLHTATYVDVVGDTMTGGLTITPASKSSVALALNGQQTLRAVASTWHPDWAALEIGRIGTIRADDTANSVTLAIQANGIYGPDAVGRAKVTGGSTMHVMSTNQWVFYGAPSVAAGATQTYTQRMTMNTLGTMAFYPEPGSSAIVTTNNSPTAVVLQSGGGIQFNDAANNYGMGFRMRGSPVVLDVTYLGNNTGAYFDSAGNVKVNALTADSVSIQHATGGLRVYHRDNFGLYHEFYAAGATLRFYESGYGDAFTFNRVAGGLFVYSPENTGTSIRVGSAYSQPGVYSSGTLGLLAEGVVQVKALGSNIHLQAGAGVMHPLTDNVMMCGYPSYRFTSVCAVAGTINTSVAAAKRNIAPLDPVACTQAVLETDWVSFEYLPPALQEAHIPEGKTGESFEERKQRLLTHQKFVADTAHQRKQNGYVLQSPDHKVHDLFGLSDRESASPSADLGILACALQAALQRVAALEKHLGVSV